MKIGIITRSNLYKGSTRVRALQYIDFWEAEGCKVRVLQRETNTSILYRLLFIKNIFKLALWSDIVFLQKPNLSAFLLDLIYSLNKNIVVDFDDAVWCRPPIKSSLEPDSLNEVFGKRLVGAIKKSKAVIAGSNYLGGWAKEQVPDTRRYVVPPSVDTVLYNPQIQHKDREKEIIIGWVGSEGNMVDLKKLDSVVKKINQNSTIKFLIISSKPMDLMEADFLFDKWTIETEMQSLSKIDIGIMPLIDDERSRGRCGYKAIQYMALGIPVISSPVGGACEVVEDKVTGILASTNEEWYEAILKLAGDAKLRQKYGEKGREKVEQLFSTQNNSLHLLEIFKKIIA